MCISSSFTVDPIRSFPLSQNTPVGRDPRWLWSPIPLALHQAGLRIPQDISLFGFDDAPCAKWLEPALSSVYLPIDSMIVTAIDQAIRLANNQPVETIPPFTGTLVLRDSVTTGPYYASK